MPLPNMQGWQAPGIGGAYQTWKRYQDPNDLGSFRDGSGDRRYSTEMDQTTTGPGFMPQGLDLPNPGYPQVGGGVPRPPSENSMQKAQTDAEAQNAGQQIKQDEQQDMKGLSPQRRYFWATGRVDARPTQNPNNTATRMMPNPQWNEFFGPNPTHMGGAGVTWQQRQQQNQTRIADVRKLRDLSPY